MPEPRFRLTGADRLARKLGQLAASRLVREAAARGLFQASESILTASKPLVPVDTGALRASGFVEPPNPRAELMQATIGYGGPAAPYAVVQHERVDFRHVVGQAKYLEQPLLEAAPRVPRQIARHVRQAIRREVR